MNPYGAYPHEPDPDPDKGSERYFEWLQAAEDATAADGEHVGRLCEEWGWTWAAWHAAEGRTGLVPLLKPGVAPRDSEVEAEAADIFRPFQIFRPPPTNAVAEGAAPHPLPSLASFQVFGAAADRGPAQYERREALYNGLRESVRGASGLEILDHIARFGAQHEALTRTLRQYGAAMWSDLDSGGLEGMSRMLMAWYEHARAGEDPGYRDPDGIYWGTKRIWGDLTAAVLPDADFEDNLRDLVCRHGADRVLGEAVVRGVVHHQRHVHAIAVQAVRVQEKHEAVGEILHAITLDRVPPPFSEVLNAEVRARSEMRKPGGQPRTTVEEAISLSRDYWAVRRTVDARSTMPVSDNAIYEAIIEARGAPVGSRTLLNYRGRHPVSEGEMSESEQHERFEAVRRALPFDVKRLLK